MHSDFWHERWNSNRINFHASEANHLLRAHHDKLNLAEGARVFLPLCGKTLDIAWLLSRGFSVVGAELVRIAIEQLFDELKVEPEIRRVGKLEHFSAPNIDMFVGDVFELTQARLGTVDAVYDRAALVALPSETRERYTRHLTHITNNAPQLLITFDYDQDVMSGPPFSISTEAVHGYYGKTHKPTLLESVDVPGGLKGQAAAKENAWLLAR